MPQRRPNRSASKSSKAKSPFGGGHLPPSTTFGPITVLLTVVTMQDILRLIGREERFDNPYNKGGNYARLRGDITDFITQKGFPCYHNFLKTEDDLVEDESFNPNDNGGFVFYEKKTGGIVFIHWKTDNCHKVRQFPLEELSKHIVSMCKELDTVPENNSPRSARPIRAREPSREPSRDRYHEAEAELGLTDHEDDDVPDKTRRRHTPSRVTFAEPEQDFSSPVSTETVTRRTVRPSRRITPISDDGDEMSIVRGQPLRHSSAAASAAAVATPSRRAMLRQSTSAGNTPADMAAQLAQRCVVMACTPELTSEEFVMTLTEFISEFQQ